MSPRPVTIISLSTKCRRATICRRLRLRRQFVGGNGDKLSPVWTSHNGPKLFLRKIAKNLDLIMFTPADMVQQGVRVPCWLVWVDFYTADGKVARPALASMWSDVNGITGGSLNDCSGAAALPELIKTPTTQSKWSSAMDQTKSRPAASTESVDSQQVHP